MSKQETWTVYGCPQCGLETFTLHEGYCKSCCDENQRQLDEHNAGFDRWSRMTDAERSAEIKAAARRA